MPVEVPSLGEALGAVRAPEGLLLVVESLVGDQVTMADVALAAERAPMRFRPRVHVEVSSQVAALNEALSALLAVEPLVLLCAYRVDLLVACVVSQAIEGSAAHFALEGPRVFRWALRGFL